jgi:NADPH:quinone reductase
MMPHEYPVVLGGDAAVDGTLTADITTVLPLEQATDGLATIANGNARGKIVIKISD